MSTFAFSDDKSKVDISSLVSGGVTVDMVYPVGSIFISTVSADPSTYMPNTTWQRIQGRFLVAAGDNGASGDEAMNIAAGATGGESSHRLTANESGVAAHGHSADIDHTHEIRPHAHRCNDYAFVESREIINRRSVKKWESKDGESAMAKNHYYGEGAITRHAYTSSELESRSFTGSMRELSSTPIGSATPSAASVSHNNLPPYLAVYMWRRTS